MKFKFTVPGEPLGKQRPKFTRNGHAYTPEKTANYEPYVKYMFSNQCRNCFFEKDVPVDVRIRAFYKIPESVSKKKKALMLAHFLRPTKKPDSDNVVKIICDSLNGVAYHDDAQVVDEQFRKFYSDKPRVEVVIKKAWTAGETDE